MHFPLGPPKGSFRDEPTEAPTGRTGIVMGEWRQISSIFAELDHEAQGALLQIAHALLSAQQARARRVAH